MKVIWIKKYNETESIFLFKCHHCLADGLGLVTLLSNVQDNFDISQLPLMKRLTLKQRLMIWAMLPFGVI